MSNTNTSSPCWQYEDSNIHQGIDWHPCGPYEQGGPVLSCCKFDDACLEAGICHYTHELTGGSKFYKGSCTDPKYEDALCPQHCDAVPLPDIVWDKNSKEWQCCGTNTAGSGPSCNAPTTDEFFSAPGPLKLATTATAGQTTLPTISSATSSSASQAKSSAASSAAASISPALTSSSAGGDRDDSSGLSTGAQAGIGAGAGVIGLAAIGAIIYLLLARRKHAREQAGPAELPNSSTAGAQAGQYDHGTVHLSAPVLVEADSQPRLEMAQPDGYYAPSLGQAHKPQMYPGHEYNPVELPTTRYSGISVQKG